MKQIFIPRVFAGVFGFVYLILGIARISVTGTPGAGHQLFSIIDFGQTPDVLHVIVGVLGLVAAASGAMASLRFAQVVAVVYAVIAAAAFVQRPLIDSNTTGNMLAFDAVIALVALTVSLRGTATA